MKKILLMSMVSIVLFQLMPLSAFAQVHTQVYYAPWRDEYRVDHTGMPAYSFHKFRLNFTSSTNVVYNSDFNSYTGIMYLTCNGKYKLQFIDENENILDESAEIVTTAIQQPTCLSYPEQSGVNDLSATQTDKGDGTHQLDWQADPGAATYEIWKDGVKVGETSDTSFLLDGPGSVSIVAKDANGNPVGTSDMQVPTYDGGDSWGGGGDPGNGGGCNTCQKLSELLACPDWSTYMGEWENMLRKVIPPPPDWEAVSQTFVNAFDNYFGEMPTPPTVAEIEQRTSTPLPVVDNSFGAASNLVPTVPAAYNNPIDFDLSDAPVIEIVDESQPFIILDPLHNLETSPVGVGVIPGDPQNNSGDITQPQTIPGLTPPTPSAAPPADPLEYEHSDIPIPSGSVTPAPIPNANPGDGPIPEYRP